MRRQRPRSERDIVQFRAHELKVCHGRDACGTQHRSIASRTANRTAGKPLQLGGWPIKEGNHVRCVVCPGTGAWEGVDMTAASCTTLDRHDSMSGSASDEVTQAHRSTHQASPWLRFLHNECSALICFMLYMFLWHALVAARMVVCSCPRFACCVHR